MSILFHLRRLFRTKPPEHVDKWKKAEEQFSLYWEYDNITRDASLAMRELVELCQQTRDIIRSGEVKKVPMEQLENVQGKLMRLQVRMGALQSAADGSTPGHYVNQMREQVLGKKTKVNDNSRFLWQVIREAKDFIR